MKSIGCTFFIFLFFPFIGIFKLGKETTHTKWEAVFCVTTFIYVFSLYMGNEFNERFWVPIFAINWLFSIIYLIYLDGFNKDLPPKEKPLPPIKAQPSQKTPPPMSVRPKTEEEKFMADMRKWRSEVESADMKNHIDNILKFSDLVQKKDKETGLKFIKRYRTPLNSLLHKYDEIENTCLESEELKNAMSSMEKSLGVIAEALKKEVISLYKTDVLDMDAETSAFIQSLKSRGLIEE